MERTKKFILKKIQKIFLFVKICEKKMPSERAKSFYFDRDVNCTSYY